MGSLTFHDLLLVSLVTRTMASVPLVLLMSLAIRERLGSTPSNWTKCRTDCQKVSTVDNGLCPQYEKSFPQTFIKIIEGVDAR